MIENIWNKCKGEKYIEYLNEKVVRLDDIETPSLRKLVDTNDELNILENLIVSSKNNKKIPNVHPLISFKSPAKYASRFGKQFEKSIWYSSIDIQTAFAEIAFYRFNFLHASKVEFDLVEKNYSSFVISIETPKAIKLHKEPFIHYKNTISSPVSYDHSQFLGSMMRDANIEAFTYLSARSINDGLNVGVFSQELFYKKIPDAFQTWQCIANKDTVEFSLLSAAHQECHRFNIKNFLVNDVLPFPAS